MFEDILVILKITCLKRILVSSVPLLTLKKLKGPTPSIKDYASLRSFWNGKNQRGLSCLALTKNGQLYSKRIYLHVTEEKKLCYCTVGHKIAIGQL